MPRASIESKAKEANGRSRMCAKCKFGSACPADILSICSRSFVEGYRKGYQKAKVESSKK